MFQLVLGSHRLRRQKFVPNNPSSLTIFIYPILIFALNRQRLLTLPPHREAPNELDQQAGSRESLPCLK